MNTRAVHLPMDLFKFVRAQARANERTVPAQMRVIIREWKMQLDKEK